METVIHRGRGKGSVSSRGEEALKICLGGTSLGPSGWTLPSSAGSVGLIPGQEVRSRMPHSQKTNT